MPKPSKHPVPFKAKAIAWVSVLVIRLFALTLRSRVVDHRDENERQPVRSVIWATWHHSLFAFPIVYQRHFPEQKGAAMASASKDGAIVAEVLRLFGVEAIRGSSSRRGGQALLEMASWLEDGYSVGLTPDGPKGPRENCSRGMNHLGSMTGASSLLVRMDYRSCWELNSWDRFRIPKPFSRIDFHLGPSADIPPGLTADTLEPYRKQVEALLCGAEPDAEPESHLVPGAEVAS